MINVNDKNVKMSGKIEEIIEDIALIKITIINELGSEKANYIYELSEKLAQENLDSELFTKFKRNLPDNIAKKLIKLWKKLNCI